ncbi:MAG: glycosyltransferase, partial [Candidatus Binataceae bacterium]
MHYFVTGLLGIAALLWMVCAFELARGVPSIPSIADVAPLEDEKCPAVSILFAARDEAVKLPAALETMLTLDYPRYEVVAVDDRSVDATETILKHAAEKDTRLKRVRVDSLPAGWLGKPHALEQAFENSSGEWLVFTDADVHFEPGVLRRSIALAESRGWDHMP